MENWKTTLDVGSMRNKKGESYFTTLSNIFKHCLLVDELNGCLETPEHKTEMGY